MKKGMKKMEFLKPVFENGVNMTYEEFVDAISLHNQRVDKKEGIKLANLSQGEYVSVHKFHDKVRQLTEVKQALKEAGIVIETYEAEMMKLHKQLETKEYQLAVETFFHHYTFTSEYARRGIQHMFEKQSFTLDKNILQGAEEFMKKIQLEDPAAFKINGTMINNIQEVPLSLVLQCK